MKTFKKKDFMTETKEELDELINPDGSPIDGAANGHKESEIRTAPQQTGDEFADSSRQGPRPYFGNYGTAYSHGVRVNAGEEKDGDVIEEEDDEVDESKIKMEKVLEDIFTKKNKGNDIVSKEKKTIKSKIIDVLDKYKSEEDSEIYQDLVKLKDNL